MLLYEVVWLRLLTLSMGYTSRAVGILLAAFTGGLAVGAWTAGRSASSMTPARARRAYAALEASIAACAVFSRQMRLAYLRGDFQEGFSEALFLSPTHSGALDGLAEAYDRQGNRGRAAGVRARTPAR